MTVKVSEHVTLSAVVTDVLDDGIVTVRLPSVHGRRFVTVLASDLSRDALAEFVRHVANHPDIGDALTAGERELALQAMARELLFVMGT